MNVLQVAVDTNELIDSLPLASYAPNSRESIAVKFASDLIRAALEYHRRGGAYNDVRAESYLIQAIDSITAILP